MTEKIEEIASRVRELRELYDISAAEMAGYLNTPMETYNGYEEGNTDIPASVLFEIANKLEVSMSLLLTGTEPRMHIFTVTRKGEGVDVERRKQYKYQNLAEKFIHKKAEPFLVTVEPRNDRPSTNSHPGQEFDYILKGSLKFYIHDHEIVLNEGDCIFFDSSYEHAMVALNDEPSQMLVFVM